MPGPLVQFGAQILCSHAGQATATVSNPRVTLSGAPSLSLSTPMVIAGCTLPPPSAANGPCVTGQWLTGTTRVLSNGLPLVVQSSSSICAPSGTPMMIVAAQPRVTAL